MIETNLSIYDCEKWFDRNRLGRLYLPNGKGKNNPSEFKTSGVSIDLRKLFEMVSGWENNQYKYQLEDIAGIIAHGSAIAYPNYYENPIIRKKYYLFGSEITKIKRVPIEPKDVDFFVIYGKNIGRNEFSEVGEPVKNLHGYVRGKGIHIVSGGIEQIIEGSSYNEIIISAMRYGVPVFYDDKKLEDVQKRTGIKRETRRKLFWDEDENGYLVGKIE